MLIPSHLIFKSWFMDRIRICTREVVYCTRRVYCFPSSFFLKCLFVIRSAVTPSGIVFSGKRDKGGGENGGKPRGRDRPEKGKGVCRERRIAGRGGLEEEGEGGEGGRARDGRGQVKR